MSAAKHTPGPWTVADFDKPNEVFVQWNYGYAAVHGERLGREANARLIAAAPDLLAALRDLVAIDDAARADGSSGYVKGSPIDRKWRAARAAIAKAEGTE